MRTPKPHTRSGMTLLELLVVILIAGLLFAMLLAAVQSVRESQRRATCEDHLRQLGVALYSHATTHQTLPALYNGDFLPQPRNAIDEFHFHSWRTAILPQIEQSVLFAQINMGVPATVASNQTAINVGISLFVCPSTNSPHRIVPDILAWNDGAIPVAKVGTAARSDYEVLGGVQAAAQTRSSSDLSIIRFGPWGEPTYNVSNGASLGYRKARFSDITDGLATTILVGERAGRPDLYRKGEPVDPYPYRDPTQGPDHHQAAWALSTHFWWLVLWKEQSINQTNRTGIFSFHPGGSNVLFADGSAHFLKDSTAPPVLAGLVTRAGGEVVDSYGF